MGVVGTSTVEFDGDLTKLLQKIDQAKQGIAGISKQTVTVGGAGASGGLDTLSRSALNLAKGFLTVQAAEKGFQFVQTGAQALDTSRSFDRLATSAHTTGDALLTSLRAAADGTINDVTLMKNANLALEQTQGRIAKDLPQLLTIARAAAISTGQDVDTTFQKLVSGVDKGRAASLASLGIVIDQKKVYADYAQSIGVAVSHLTKEEQQQALTNAVLKQGADLVKTVGLNSDDASVQIQKAVTAAQNLATALAAKVAPTAGTVAGGLANLLNGGEVNPATVAGGTQTQGNLIAASTSFEDYAKRIRAANDQISAAFKGDPIAGALARQLYGLEQLNPVQEAYAKSLIDSGTAAQPAIDAAKRLGDVSDALTQQTQGQSAAFQALIPQMAAVSASSTDNASQVLALNSAYLQGQVSIDQVRQVLDGLSRAQDLQAQAAFQEERENRNLARTFDAIVPAANAAQAAIAAMAGANPNQLPHLNENITGAFSGVGDLLTKGLDHAAASSNRATQEQLSLIDSEIALANAKKNTGKEIDLLRQKQALYAKGTAEYNNIQAQIIGIETSAGRTRVSAAQSTALQLENVAENSGARLLQIERENQEKLRDAQEDFDVKRARSKEDEERKIRDLLARGQRAQAQREREDFARQQQREQEDFDRQRRRTLRDNAERTGDTTGAEARRTGQIEARAALRGVRPTQDVSVGTAPASSALGGAAASSILTLRVQFAPQQINVDGTKVIDVIYPEIERRIDTSLADEFGQLGVVISPSGGQTAVSGP